MSILVAAARRSYEPPFAGQILWPVGRKVIMNIIIIFDQSAPLYFNKCGWSFKMATDVDFSKATEKILQHFNVTALKPEQNEILRSIMDQRDCMAILPTGYGKSLPYPMYIPLKRELGDTTPTEIKVLVCSPLIALMQDQVDRVNSIPNVVGLYKGM